MCLRDRNSILAHSLDKCRALLAGELQTVRLGGVIKRAIANFNVVIANLL
jgi:hypothetical protein